ncbi:MAG: hypothetical protein MUO19_02910 [Dehalococcoidales bacterium]|nr:hypothetical protein [Dehalococcoidales bacterium]
MVSDNNEETVVTEELKKLAAIATDMQLSGKMRDQAVNQLGGLGSHEALLVLLNLAANDHLNKEQRDLALKKARAIIKKTPQ